MPIPDSETKLNIKSAHLILPIYPSSVPFRGKIRSLKKNLLQWKKERLNITDVTTKISG